LTRHFPDRKPKVMARIRDLRGGRLNDPRFSSRMTGEGPLANAIRDLFDMNCRRLGIASKDWVLSTAAFRVPGGTQKTLFE
jgi:hypothetical protein